MNDDVGCPHYTIVRVPARKEPSDPIALPRTCLKCGAAFIIYRINLKDHPDKEAWLKIFAKEATDNIPSL